MYLNEALPTTEIGSSLLRGNKPENGLESAMLSFFFVYLIYLKFKIIPCRLQVETRLPYLNQRKDYVSFKIRWKFCCKC